ncbi:spore germination protein [Paenibacillus sp. JTLBN-2024]
MRGIANDKVVQEILQRLDRIDTDSILESGYIEEFIQDEAFSPFPTMTNTERPDAIAGALWKGRSPFWSMGAPSFCWLP